MRKIMVTVSKTKWVMCEDGAAKVSIEDAINNNNDGIISGTVVLSLLSSTDSFFLLSKSTTENTCKSRCYIYTHDKSFIVVSLWWFTQMYVYCLYIFMHLTPKKKDPPYLRNSEIYNQFWISTKYEVLISTFRGNKHYIHDTPPCQTLG